MDDLRNRVEAILFASGKGMSEEELANYCKTTVKDIKKTLRNLQEDLEKREGSLILSLHNNRWKMTVRGKYLKDVENIVSETELSEPILRTLAVVAFKSPVLQADVVHIRGQSAYEHIKELAKQKFLTREERGRSYLLKITDKFYTYFDVEGDEEIQDVFSQLREKQKTLGELEIVDSKPEDEKKEGTKEENKHLGELDVVDIVPRRREKTQDDEQEEKDFLKRIDEGINAISKRVETQTLPKRKESDEEEKEEDETEKKETTQDEEDPLEAIEKLATKQDKEEDENYL